MSKIHLILGDTVACGCNAAEARVTTRPAEVTCGNCRRRFGKTLGKAVARMAPAPNPAFPQPKRESATDPRTVAVAYTCSKCRSFVRERIPMRFREDFRGAVMAGTIRCGC